MPGQIPPPPGAWTTVPGDSLPTLSRPITASICGIPIVVPPEVQELTQRTDWRVGDALERRTRVGTLEGGPPEWIVTLRSEYQWSSDLNRDGGSSPDTWMNLARLSFEKPTPVFGRFGTYLEYTNWQNEFSGRNEFIPGTDEPWGTLHRLAAGANMFQPVSEAVAIFLAGDVRSHVEDGASLSDGFSWAVTVGAGWRVSDKLDLGAGVIVQDTFGDEIFVIGGPQFDWRPSQAWRLVLSGTEMEVQWNPNTRWQVGAGAGLIGHRYRLAPDAPGLGQIAAESRAPVFLQVRYRGVESLDLTWRVGVDLWREFTIRDASGNWLRSYTSDPAPFVGFRGILRF